MRPLRHAVSFVVRRGTAAPSELLTVRRPPDDEELPDVWGLPAASLRPGESWWEAVRRAGRDKLGVGLGRLRLRNEARAERAGRTLHMRLFEAEVTAGEPAVAQPAGGVTQYVDLAWAPAARLEEAAGRGSLCSRLCLEWLGGAGSAGADAGPAGADAGPAGADGGPAGADGEPAGADARLAAATAAGELTAVRRFVRAEGVVVRGHGVASGEAPEPFLPGGTIGAQTPAFLDRGLDLSDCHPATLNISLVPRRLAWEHPRITFREVEWHPGLPAETFSFSPCRVVVGGRARPAWLYRPHPETKPRHHQPSHVVELIAQRLERVGHGSRLGLELDPAEVRVEERPGAPRRGATS